MRYGYWMPVFGGWLRNVEDEKMEASWEYVSRLARRSVACGGLARRRLARAFRLRRLIPLFPAPVEATF